MNCGLFSLLTQQIFGFMLFIPRIILQSTLHPENVIHRLQHTSTLLRVYWLVHLRYNDSLKMALGCRNMQEFMYGVWGSSCVGWYSDCKKFSRFCQVTSIINKTSFYNTLNIWQNLSFWNLIFSNSILLYLLVHNTVISIKNFSKA